MLGVTFDDGTVAEVDLLPHLWGPRFEPLCEDPELFAHVRVVAEEGGSCGQMAPTQRRRCPTGIADILTTSFSGVINSLEGTYTVTDPGGLPTEAPEVVPRPWGDNGLVGPLSRSQYTICCGTRYGPVRLTFETHDEPPALELDGWTDVVEVPFRVLGTVYVSDWDGRPWYETQPAPGPHRLRVHARGRDAGAAVEWMPFDPEYGPEEEPVEEHLIQLFPGDGAEVVHRAQDGYGQMLRSSR